MAFSAFEEGIGPVRFFLLLNYFKSAQNAWSGKLTDLQNAGIPQSIAQKFIDFRNKFAIENYLKELAKKEISFVTLKDPDYPYLLSQISDPPFVLYIKGNISDVGCPIFSGVKSQTDIGSDSSKIAPASLAHNKNETKDDNWFMSDNKLAIVGTRIPTSYGKEITKILTEQLANANLTIVSGMARGVDSIAHRTAIENNAKTIAVLGCGVDLIYPPENKELYYKIADGNGCIISEMPLGHFASRGTFPARNRIISGLSKGVLMTEGASDSGALITCSYAGEQGREVFAVPGPVTSSLSAGTLALLKKGAKLVTEANDVFEELGMEVGRIRPSGQMSQIKGDNDEENKILELLKNEDLTVDDIIRRSGFSASLVGSLLSLMELKGYIKNLGNLTYGLSHC